MPNPVAAIRPHIRRRSQRVSADAARSFLVRQKQQTTPPIPGSNLSTHIESEYEPPRPTPLVHELTRTLAAIRSPDSKELDRFWGHMLDSLASGRLSPSESRLLARSLGKVRKTLKKRPSGVSETPT
ncbi:MAG: hypothetical protein HQL77_08840 [Magnetococcales bacterium]|nr:hypothetical protein [Magnetococcales bacterium]